MDDADVIAMKIQVILQECIEKCEVYERVLLHIHNSFAGSEPAEGSEIAQMLALSNRVLKVLEGYKNSIATFYDFIEKRLDITETQAKHYQYVVETEVVEPLSKFEPLFNEYALIFSLNIDDFK